PSQDEIGIGDGGLGATQSVAHRARLGAGALRPNTKRTHLSAGDRPAAGANLLDIDHGNLHRQPGGIAADEGAPRHQYAAVMDDARFRSGAAHVECDRVLARDAIAERLSADDAGGGPGLQHADARALRLLDAEQAAGRLHDQEVTDEAGSLKMLAHLA